MHHLQPFQKLWSELRSMTLFCISLQRYLTHFDLIGKVIALQKKGYFGDGTLSLQSLVDVLEPNALFQDSGLRANVSKTPLELKGTASVVWPRYCPNTFAVVLTIRSGLVTCVVDAPGGLGRKSYQA